MEVMQKGYVESIRGRYEPKSEGQAKLERLQALDREARRPAQLFAAIFGALGTLVLGVGMCLAMKVIGDLMTLGIVIGLIGLAMVSTNYFIYKSILKSRQKKYAEKILALSDELLNITTKYC